MSIEALPFVNWIFWTALTSGSLLVVGLTEVLGGTTRGYRLFMAWLMAACAGVLLLSELNLSPGTVADATNELRRWLVIALCVGAAAYLVASIARLPRAGLAVVSGIVGLVAMGALSAAGGTHSAPLFAAQLALVAVALGAVNAAMLLGHWYLVTPKLSPAPLRRMMWLLAAALVVQAGLFVASVLFVGQEPITGSIGWLSWLRLLIGTVLPIGITVLAMLASRASSLQASTGLLYIGLAFVMAGSIAGSSITYITRVPV